MPPDFQRYTRITFQGPNLNPEEPLPLEASLNSQTWSLSSSSQDRALRFRASLPSNQLPENIQGTCSLSIRGFELIQGAVERVEVNEQSIVLTANINDRTLTITLFNDNRA